MAGERRFSDLGPPPSGQVSDRRPVGLRRCHHRLRRARKHGGGSLSASSHASPGPQGRRKSNSGRDRPVDEIAGLVKFFMVVIDQTARATRNAPPKTGTPGRPSHEKSTSENRDPRPPGRREIHLRKPGPQAARAMRNPPPKTGTPGRPSHEKSTSENRDPRPPGR